MRALLAALLLSGLGACSRGDDKKAETEQEKETAKEPEKPALVVGDPAPALTAGTWLNGPAVNLCSTNQFGTGPSGAINKLGSRRFLRFSSTIAGTVTITQTATSIPAGEFADPDFVLIAPCGFRIEQTLRELGELERQPGFSALAAVRAGRVALADGNSYFNRPGPRLVESAELAALAIHPGHFEGRWRFDRDALVRWDEIRLD